jgi:hypothetical protein
MFDSLDYHLVSDGPAPLFMGELPRDYEEVPARTILNLCGVHPPSQSFGRVVHTMALLDVLDADLAPAREQLERFLAAAHLYAAHEPTYWHCHAGLNRSGLAVAAYLHLYRGLRISDAIRSLRDRRTPLVLCNSHFEGLLRGWYGDADEQQFDVVDIDAYLRERQGLRDDWR